MTRPSASKDELFAQNLFAGMNQLDAYQKAGYKGHLSSACRKAKSPKIIGRLAELREALSDVAVIDRKWVMDELVEVYKCARHDEEWQAARATLKDIGLELGMFIERKDVRVHAIFESLSDRDMLQQLAKAEQDLLVIGDGTET